MTIMCKTSFFLCILVLALFCADWAYAGSSCDPNGTARVCAPPSGGISLGNDGSYYCGPGECLKDKYGVIKCSAKAGGGAMFDSMGGILCVGGCVKGLRNLCVTPQS